jgi:hypothetical protein
MQKTDVMGIVVTEKERRYLSFMLRLWQTSSDGEQVWRASLESPGTGERRGFASLEDLFDYLEAQIDQPPAYAAEFGPDAQRRER